MRVVWRDLDLWRRGELSQVEGLDPSALELCDWLAAETARRGGASIALEDLRLSVGRFTLEEQLDGLQALDLIVVL
jgi:hypothetical protein